MSETTIKEYYNFSQPREEAKLSSNQVVWDGAAPSSLTVQPSDGAEFVKYIKLIVTNTYAMTATDEMTITVNAYGGSQVLNFISGGVVADDLAQMIAWGDPALYTSTTIGAVVTHYITIKPNPPVYLRTSTTPSESITVEYTDNAGGVSAGNMVITTEGWAIADEDDSGI